MKKLFFFAFTILSFAGLHAQGFGVGLSGGYLSELDGIGGSFDLIYEIDEQWGASSSFTFAAAEDTGIRAKWSIVDLNVRFKAIDELYLFGGGQYWSSNIEELGLGGGNPVGGGRMLDDSEFGVQVGTGYVYNLIDNVNIFGEVKYAAVNTGYFHGKLGLRFNF